VPDVVDNNDTNDPAIWWEARPVLILQQSDWPSADGSRRITTAKAMDEAESAGRAIDVGSNFFLFFSTKFSSAEAARNLIPNTIMRDIHHMSAASQAAQPAD